MSAGPRIGDRVRVMEKYASRVYKKDSPKWRAMVERRGWIVAICGIMAEVKWEGEPEHTNFPLCGLQRAED